VARSRPVSAAILRSDFSGDVTTASIARCLADGTGTTSSASGRFSLRAAGFGAARCPRTARQPRQTWTSPLQIDTGAAPHALQTPSRVSVGAAGTGRCIPSGRRCGESAGMACQRRALPMCSCVVEWNVSRLDRPRPKFTSHCYCCLLLAQAAGCWMLPKRGITATLGHHVPM